VNERLADLSAFVAAVETGGFSAAAKKLNLSRSAIGKRVAQLEARLGVRLMQRTTRSLNLTDDGAAFYERCARALADLQAAEAAARHGALEPAGRLRISAPVLLGRRCVAPVAAELAKRYPELDLELTFDDRPVDLIDEGFDLVVRNGGLPLRAPLVSKRIAHQVMGVFASPSYLARYGTPKALDDLPGHAAVLYRRTGRSKSWLFARPVGPSIAIEMEGRLKFNDLESVVDAAGAGMGLAWLPCWLAREALQSGQLVQVLADVLPMIFESRIVWPHAPHLPARVRITIDALTERLPALMAAPSGLTQRPYPEFSGP